MRTVFKPGEVHAAPILGCQSAAESAQALSFPAALHRRVASSRLVAESNICAPGSILKRVEELVRERGIMERLVEDTRDGQKKPLRNFMELIQAFPPPSADIAGLDQHAAQHPDAAANLRLVLMNIGPRLVLPVLGKDTLTWLAAYLGESLPHYRKLCQAITAFGVNFGNFEKAVRAGTHWLHANHPFRAQTVVLNYELLNRHDSDSLRRALSRDCGEMAGNARYHLVSGDDSLRFSIKKTAEYAVEAISPDGSRDYGPNKHFPPHHYLDQETGKQMEVSYRCYVDAPLGVALTWKGAPQALVSGLASDLETFFVLQVSGCQGQKTGVDGTPAGRTKSRGLVGLDWQVFLLDLAAEWAQSAGFARLGLLGASNNQWLGSLINPQRAFLFEHAVNNYNLAALRGGGWEFNNLDRNLYRTL